MLQMLQPHTTTTSPGMVREFQSMIMLSTTAKMITLMSRVLNGSPVLQPQPLCCARLMEHWITPRPGPTVPAPLCVVNLQSLMSMSPGSGSMEHQKTKKPMTQELDTSARMVHNLILTMI